jgi:hypothetical protein
VYISLTNAYFQYTENKKETTRRRRTVTSSLKELSMDQPGKRVGAGGPQSKQSAKLFLQSSELGLPQPLTRRRVCPPPFGSGGRGILSGERGVGESILR